MYSANDNISVCISLKKQFVKWQLAKMPRVELYNEKKLNSQHFYSELSISSDMFTNVLDIVNVRKEITAKTKILQYTQKMLEIIKLKKSP